MEKLAALILAAGISPCMEQWKPMLPVGNETMIRRTITTMLEAGASPVVVVTGYRGELLRGHLEDLELVFLYNSRYASTRMYDSLLLGLRHLRGRCDRLLLAPGDVPIVRPDTIRRMLEVQAQVVRPIYRGKAGHPLVLDNSCFGPLLGYRGEAGLSGALGALDLEVADLPVTDETVTLGEPTQEAHSRLLRHNLTQGGGAERLRLDTRLCLRAMDTVFSPEAAQLLEVLELTGSIKLACSAIRISYSKGWKMLRRIEQVWGFSMVRRRVGGTEGGSSELTPQGRQFLAAYRQMEGEVLEYAQQSFSQHFVDFLKLHPLPDQEPGE